MKTLGFIITLILPFAAAAATITVNTTADNTTVGDGQCTLREAIANANAAADTTGGDCAAGAGAGDAITFAVSLPATIKLFLGGLALGRNVTIEGPTTGLLAVDGNHANSIFGITADATSISNLTIQNGRSTYGGGIFNEGTVTLINCTLSGNAACNGGGIFNEGTVTLINSTLSRNKASCRNEKGNGGGILNGYFSTVTLINCTLSRNRGRYGGVGGIENDGTATMTNTIVAKNRGGNCSGPNPITSDGHNLDDDGSCFTSSGTDLVNTAPLAIKLHDNGGPTETVALRPGSPAIDAGDDAVLGPPYNLATDQRGLPRKAGVHVDIGAYEVQ